jgi:hypothetical protein
MGNKGYIKELNYGKVTVVENQDGQWGVIDNEGNIIVPFGKYGWIDGFDSGLARVRTHKNSGRAGDTTGMVIGLFSDNPVIIEGKENIQSFLDNDRIKHPEKYAKWGIINEKGEEVLPVIYDDIWNFYGKNRYSTKVEKDGMLTEVYFHELNPSLPVHHRSTYSQNNDEYSRHYGEYAGTYAQDVMGYSDEDIDAAFDGEPDAYWNID